MDLIEKENPRLKNVLNKNYSRPEIDKTRLGELVTLFTNLDRLYISEFTNVLDIYVLLPPIIDQLVR